MTRTYTSSLLACAFACAVCVGGCAGESIDWMNMPEGLTGLETVPVGSIGNGFDRTGYGAVDYAYSIGTYEVTAAQYCKFLKAVAADDTYGLYSTSMRPWRPGAVGCMIERSGSRGNYTYSVAPERANRPVNYVSWGDAARFANWLHNGQPTGAQDLTTTEDGAYYLNGARKDAELLAVRRKPGWKWAIPTEDEWYKAAYHKNDGATSNYFYYPTSSDMKPSNDLIEPDPGNNANYWADVHDLTIGSPYYRTEVGEFENSESPYGTFDQGGNVWEWNEAILEVLQPPRARGSYRGVRGGGYVFSGMESSQRQSYLYKAGGAAKPSLDDTHIGFRVVKAP